LKGPTGVLANGLRDGFENRGDERGGLCRR